jgi:hypothetical protein
MHRRAGGGFRKLGIPPRWRRPRSSVVAAALDDAVAGALRRATPAGTPDAWLAARLAGAPSPTATPPAPRSTTWPGTGRSPYSISSTCRAGRRRVPPTSGITGETPAALWDKRCRPGWPARPTGRGVRQSSRAGQAKADPGHLRHARRPTGQSPVDAVPGSSARAVALADGALARSSPGTVITAGSAVDWLVELGVARGPPSSPR